MRLFRLLLAPSQGYLFQYIFPPGINKPKLLRQVENISGGGGHHVPQVELGRSHQGLPAGRLVLASLTSVTLQPSNVESLT